MTSRMLPGILVVFLMISGILGCKATEEASSEKMSSVDIRVTNRNWLAMEVFITGQARRVRLGRLQSGATETYALPADFLKSGIPIQFEMVNVDQTLTLTSDRMVVVPGENIILIIPNEKSF